jgi:hypothetical protein
MKCVVFVLRRHLLVSSFSQAFGLSALKMSLISVCHITSLITAGRGITTIVSLTFSARKGTKKEI